MPTAVLVVEPPRITFVVPVRTSTANDRVPNSKVAGIMRRKQDAAHRDCARAETVAAMRRGHVLREWLLPCVVTLTRVSPGRGLDRHDGPQSALKRVVDGIALALGIDDGGPLVEWKYAQRRGPPGIHRVEVEIVARKA
jgi:hypothetical protein